MCRDIGGSDPERMAAPRVCEYVQEVFKDTCIKVTLVYGIYACCSLCFETSLYLHLCQYLFLSRIFQLLLHYFLLSKCYFSTHTVFQLDHFDTVCDYLIHKLWFCRAFESLLAFLKKWQKRRVRRHAVNWINRHS